MDGAYLQCQNSRAKGTEMKKKVPQNENSLAKMLVLTEYGTMLRADRVDPELRNLVKNKLTIDRVKKLCTKLNVSTSVFFDEGLQEEAINKYQQVVKCKKTRSKKTIAILEMLKTHTHTEVANQFNVSRQYVHILSKKYEKNYQ